MQDGREGGFTEIKRAAPGAAVRAGKQRVPLAFAGKPVWLVMGKMGQTGK